jgi:hypothetical protein
MNCKGPYRVYAGDDPEQCEASGAFIGERDTRKEAKELARHALTDDYRRVIEASACFKYSQVVSLQGECLDDFFAK